MSVTRSLVEHSSFGGAFDAVVIEVVDGGAPRHLTKDAAKVFGIERCFGGEPFEGERFG